MILAIMPIIIVSLHGTVGEHSLPGYEPVIYVKRAVRTRMLRVVCVRTEREKSSVSCRYIILTTLYDL